MVSLQEIVGFSLLFIFPAAAIMLVVFLISACYCLFTKRKVLFTFHWFDALVPFVTTALWCRFQSYSPFVKSLGNLAEISIIGLIWGGMFLVRSVLALKGKGIPIWKYVIVECAITVALAIFTPTFPE